MNISLQFFKRPKGIRRNFCKILNVTSAREKCPVYFWRPCGLIKIVLQILENPWPSRDLQEFFDNMFFEALRAYEKKFCTILKDTGGLRKISC